MLVLCPNHHLQFDRGVLRIRKSGETYVVWSEVKDDPLNDRTILLQHTIDDDCIKWHDDWFVAKRR
jgi:predicted restriction endonuclease